MSEVADRYDRIADGFTARLEAVPPGAWTKQSPCEEWTAHDVAKHVIDVTRLFLTRLNGGDPAPPDADDDLTSAWHLESAAVRSALADPERATTLIQGQGGDSPFEQMIGTVLCADTLIHTWDLARATGQDDRLDPDGIKAALTFLEPNDELLRSPGGMGPKIDPPPDADDQTRLLAFVGRQV